MFWPKLPSIAKLMSKSLLKVILETSSEGHMPKILLVANQLSLQATLKEVCESLGFHLEVVESSDEFFLCSRERGPFDSAIFDFDMDLERSPGWTMNLLTELKELTPHSQCLVLASQHTSSVRSAILAVKNGALDYLEKPINDRELVKLLKVTIPSDQNSDENNPFESDLKFSEGRKMIGDSSSIRHVFELIQKLAKVNTSVLIRGESGTGKELVARALHFNSNRKKGPFVAVNCGAIPENLIESELFGHEKGTFTGADRRKIGKFQFAAGGTIFLDEIGDITPQMQVKLLRVLQEKKFTPVGSNQELKADVRIISATNRHLEEMIKQNGFREDLFYRLNVLPINLPPLRDRRDDIAALTQMMIAKFNHIHQRQIKGLEPVALQALNAYSWPGNIRELENVVEHAFIIETNKTIHLKALPEAIQACAPIQYFEASPDQGEIDPTTAPLAFDKRSPSEPNGIITDFSDLKYPVLKERFEREFIIRALKAYQGRINHTAEQTLMTKVTLLRKLEKYGINPRDFRT